MYRTKEFIYLIGAFFCFVEFLRFAWTYPSTYLPDNTVSVRPKNPGFYQTSQGGEDVITPLLHKMDALLDKMDQISSAAMNGNASTASDGPSREFTPLSSAQIDYSRSKVQDIHVPLQAFEEWKAWHSRQVIDAELEAFRKYGASLPKRQWIVAQFSCPERAGNFIHDLLNSLVIAVVTNRSLIMNHHVANEWFAKRNSEENCARAMQLADWIPRFTPLYRNSYDGLAKGVRRDIDLPMSKLGPHPFHDAYREDPLVRMWPDNVTESNKNALGMKFKNLYHWNLGRDNVWTGLVNLKDEFGRAFFSQYMGFENDEYADKMIDRLYKHGITFMYGMLLKQTTRFSMEIEDSVARYKARPQGISIALHSRHPKVYMNGGNVTGEIGCIDEVLGKLRTDEEEPCTLYLMTDRVLTVKRLKPAVIERKCKFVHVKPEALDTDRGATSETQEHGPFAGMGFFQDWNVASQARSAIISGLRSSSALVYETMTYDGIMEGSMDAPPMRCLID